MNIIRRLFAAILPRYRETLLNEQHAALAKGLLDCLPEEYKSLKSQTLEVRFHGFSDWPGKPEFKLLDLLYPGETLFKFRKAGENYTLSGFTILSNITQKHETAELLIKDNLPIGIRISNAAYKLHEYDLQTITAQQIAATPYTFEPSQAEIFYESLREELRSQLSLDDLQEIELNNRVYFSFFDLEDGNYLAVDKNLIAYSLVHDAKPMAKRLKKSFPELLHEVKNGKFDVDLHLNERYETTNP